MKDEIYSIQEAAKILKVSERSIFRYINSGKLRATKIGYWRIFKSDIQKFLNDNVSSVIIHAYNGNFTSVKGADWKLREKRKSIKKPNKKSTRPKKRAKKEKI